jgi:hypothetical protein
LQQLQWTVAVLPSTVIRISIVVRVILAMLMSLVGASALAWGTQGHQVIANVANAQLTPKARAEVDRLLALEPGATLASISTRADETRNGTTARWHYVNFPKVGADYVEQFTPVIANQIADVVRHRRRF